MRTSFILTVIGPLLSLSLLAQARWDGGGDGTTWQDATNWSNDEIPLATSIVYFDSGRVTVIGSPVDVAGIQLESGVHLTLQLDVAVSPHSTEPFAITVGDRSTLELGDGSQDRTFTLRGSGDGYGLVSFKDSREAVSVIHSRSVVHVSGFIRGIYLEEGTASLTNRGSIRLDSTNQTGLRVAGTVTNAGRIEADRLTNDLFTVSGTGSVVNTEAGEIIGLESGDDGIELTDTASFTNEGEIRLTSPASARSSNNCLSIGLTGGSATFTNRSDRLFLDGGAGGDARPVFVYEPGRLENSGTLTVTGGSDINRFYVEGSARMDTNAVLLLNGGRISVAPSGRLTNDGLIDSDFTSGGVTSEGFALNRAFYRYALDTAFATGPGQNEDRGLALPGEATDTAIVLSAGGECAVHLVAAPYRFFVDQDFIGITEDSGNLEFPTSSVDSSSVILTTTLPQVRIEVTDLCPAAFRPVSSTGDITAAPLRAYPTLLSSGQSITLDLSALPPSPLVVHAFDLAGRRRATYQLIGGDRRTVAISSLTPGIYALTLITGHELRTVRVRIK